jgi:uncharacterized protein (TIGR02246 family)
MRPAFAALPLILILSTLAVGQTTGGQTATSANSTDDAGIARVLADFSAAWNVHDAKAFSMTFAEDADFTNVRGAGAHGREGVEKFHSPSFATYFKASHLTITGTKIRYIKPDVAAVDSTWEMTGAMTPDGKVMPPRKGLLNFVMTEDRGTWLITIMHNMNLAPRS